MSNIAICGINGDHKAFPFQKRIGMTNKTPHRNKNAMPRKAN
jgi:hypothetical protein